MADDQDLKFFQQGLPNRHSKRPSDLPNLGFTKLELPRAFLPLRRTASDPPPNMSAEFPSSPSPSPSPAPAAAASNQPPTRFPPNNPGSVIHRTFSDPSPITNGTPPRPPAARCRDTPTTKRLKRMKERLREMTQWWNQVVSEEEEEEQEEQEENNEYETDIVPKEESECTDVENPPQEAVWVENNGDCLVLHFKCPCGNGYQILLSGRNCYYKLTNF